MPTSGRLSRNYLPSRNESTCRGDRSLLSSSPRDPEVLSRIEKQGSPSNPSRNRILYFREMDPRTAPPTFLFIYPCVNDQGSLNLEDLITECPFLYPIGSSSSTPCSPARGTFSSPLMPVSRYSTDDDDAATTHLQRADARCPLTMPYALCLSDRLARQERLTGTLRCCVLQVCQLRDASDVHQRCNVAAVTLAFSKNPTLCPEHLSTATAGATPTLPRLS